MENVLKEEKNQCFKKSRPLALWSATALLGRQQYEEPKHAAGRQPSEDPASPRSAAHSASALRLCWCDLKRSIPRSRFMGATDRDCVGRGGLQGAKKNRSAKCSARRQEQHGSACRHGDSRPPVTCYVTQRGTKLMVKIFLH